MDLPAYTVDGQSPSQTQALLDAYRAMANPNATTDDMFADLYCLNQRTILTTDSKGQATWAFPIAYPAGKLPNVIATLVKPASGAVATSLAQVTLIGDPSATSCTIRVEYLQLVTGLLSLAAAPAGVKVHIRAELP